MVSGILQMLLLIFGKQEDLRICLDCTNVTYLVNIITVIFGYTFILLGHPHRIALFKMITVTLFLD